MAMPDFSGVVEGSQYLTSVNDKGVAFQGFDVVAAHQSRALVGGSEGLSCRYNGANYNFSSQQNLNQFFTNPQRYAPQYGATVRCRCPRGWLRQLM